jgi:hypothetical protein
MERDILTTLSYRVHVSTVHEDAIVYLRQFLAKAALGTSARLSEVYEKLIFDYLEFVAYLSVHSTALVSVPTSVVVPAMIMVSLKYLKLALKIKLKTLIGSSPTSALALEAKTLTVQLNIVRALYHKISDDQVLESRSKAIEVSKTV